MNNNTTNKFYLFSQNNSGGYFVTDDGAGVGKYIIIQANSFDEAYDRLYKIGENVKDFTSGCSCCGERWEVPEECDNLDSAIDYLSNLDLNYYIHYDDGKIEKETGFQYYAKRNIKN